MTAARIAAMVLVCVCTGASVAGAQSLTANDDLYSIPFGSPSLVVEAFGVLDNDDLDGEPAGEAGATAQLVSDVSHGTLSLASDGSFTYAPGPTFDGTDSFVYEAVYAAVTSQATVTLSACSGGPEVFTCWKEGAFLAMAAAAGLPSFQEGFEDDAAWGAARSPATALTVSHRGIRWRANDFDPTHVEPPWPPDPPPNQITTGPGPARTGAYGVFDPEHGYAVGSIAECDVATPPANCFHHDGITVSPEPGAGPLHGAGGWFKPSSQADVAIVLDGDWQNPIGGGLISGYQFFGVLDVGPTGFSEVQFREVDGRISDAFYVFADDFTVLAEPQDAFVPSVPALTPAGWASLVAALAIVTGLALRRHSPRNGSPLLPGPFSRG
jgi:hypothetical protein